MGRELRIFERPTLERPVLIGAFRGWNDGGQAATLAAGYLARSWEAEKFAEIDLELVVTLGALLADVPHTRPAPVTGAATDPRLVDELGLQLSRYEGPTGIVGVLLDACRRAGIPSVSLWAAVPHYVSLAPSPKAARALCERLGGVLSTEIDVGELAEASDEYVDQVSQAV